jgi:hypothetical protein
LIIVANDDLHAIRLLLLVGLIIPSLLAVNPILDAWKATSGFAKACGFVIGPINERMSPKKIFSRKIPNVELYRG